MSEFHDDTTSASDSVSLSLSESKLRLLQPELYGWRSLFTSAMWGTRRLRAPEIRRMIAEHIKSGDSRAAVVVQVEPALLVAAYTDEQDAVVLLEFPPQLAAEHQLKPGSKLLTVNTYGRGKKVMSDIVEGPNSTGRWANVYPVIAEFVSDDLRVIEQRKRGIAPAEWQRAAQFAKARMSAPRLYIRDGRPLGSRSVGKLLTR